ncbi:serine/threonine protein kinase [Mycobacterium ahvazicum]|uniref:non-specific serine/threonine protein kinase n=1 Tax=Mycobacterium ahvazicum TaxID=1964395 RepID=A0A2K4YIV7_9MYCO|nr:serine/threonine protein kinase [Mycobacterium ahvazicum]
MPLGEGAQFAGYTVIRPLGIGGMGEVYLVRHPRLPRFEALKILRADVSADPDFQQRFNREAELAGSLWHPHIVGVHDRGEFDGQLWIAMDYVNGPDIRALMDQHPGGMPVGEVVAVVTAVAAALDHAHHRGLLHRDVKPGNIMISRPEDGSPPRILLSDFGIARPVDDNTGLTVTNATVGTVDYSAPEQLLGHPIDGRADQYALAATAYYLLTGTKLFTGASPVAVISAHLTAPPPLLGALRPDLAGADPVFARALAKNPAERFARCGDFATALARQLHHAPPAEPARPAPVAQPMHTPAMPAPQFGPPAWSGPEQRPRPRRWRAAALVTAGVAVVGIVAAIAIPRVIDHGHPAAQSEPQLQEAARLAGQHYLEALARGDAPAALALSVNPPATPQFATSEVLRAQLAAAPITDITATVAPVPAGDDPQQVQYLMVSARFGPTLSQARIEVHRKGDEWKLDTATVAVDVGPSGSKDASLKAVAVWGVATDGASPVAVFPGAMSVSSSNRYVDITAQTPPVLLDALGGATDRPAIKPAAMLNDAGSQAAKAAFDTWTHNCYHGVEPADDCARLSPDNPTIATDGPGDFSKATFNFDAARMVVAIGGTIVYQGHAAGVPDYTVTEKPIGIVDLTKEPPIYVRTEKHG